MQRSRSAANLAAFAAILALIVAGCGDGAELYALFAVLEFEEGAGAPRIRVVDGDGNARTIDTPGAALGPRWSPDGEHLAFAELSRTGGGLVLRIVHRKDWTESVATIDGSDRAVQLAWSPDSEVLALVGAVTTLFDPLAQPEGRAAFPVAEGAFVAAGAAWSPNSSRLAAGIGEGHTWIVLRDGSYSELAGAPPEAGLLGVGEWLSDLELLMVRLSTPGPPWSVTLAPGRILWRELSAAEVEEVLSPFSPNPAQTQVLSERFPDAEIALVGPTVDGTGRMYGVSDPTGTHALAVFADAEGTEVLATFEANDAIAGSLVLASSVVVVR